MAQLSPTTPAHDTATSNSPPALNPTTTSPQPPDYNAPSSPPPRRVRFHSPPPSLRSEADNDSLPTYTAASKYGKFGSEAEYLAAMRAWAEEQMYMDPGDRGLVGFYGKTTIQDYINRPGGGWRSEPKKKKGVERERTGGDIGAGGERERDRRKGSLSKWLGRKRGGSVMG